MPYGASESGRILLASVCCYEMSTDNNDEIYITSVILFLSTEFIANTGGEAFLYETEKKWTRIGE